MKLREVKGVGSKTEEYLNRLGLYTAEDALLNRPRRYEDRKNLRTISDDSLAEAALFKVKVISSPIMRQRNMMMFDVCDEKNNAKVFFFGMNFYRNIFKPGKTFYFFGKLSKNKFGYSFSNPVFYNSLNTDRLGYIGPIYNLVKGLYNSKLVSIVSELLNTKGLVKEIIPEVLIRDYNLYGIDEALKELHFPTSHETLEKARRTLAFREIFTVEYGFKVLRKEVQDENYVKFKHFDEEDDFIKGLGFELTPDQKTVIDEINADMQADKRMNRLVQGDVGSGKTIVAVYAMYKAHLNGYQAAMMAPTEILAKQHYESLKDIFKDKDIKVALLSSSISNKEKNVIYEGLESGEIDIVVGTHSIIQDKVNFNKLGLVITDEQHRFGVKQRANLTNKSIYADTLVMSATPIPRTMSLIFYGDLDISTIKTMPPGRKKVETYAVPYSYKERIFNFIEKELKKSKQVYVVTPLIEESDSLDLANANDVYLELKEHFKDYNVALLHGKTSNEEKNKIMSAYEANEVQILVSTTVIEVGVNVPNANLMIILNAERFGLSTLHQLRGRVGRSSDQAYCVLVYDKLNDISYERLKLMQETGDGFEISKKDLTLRGPGDFFGTKQHGSIDFKFFNFDKDTEMINDINKEVLSILRGDIDYEKDRYEALLNNMDSVFYDSKQDIILN